MKISGLNEENLQTLFTEFPMPLALLKFEDGVEFVNKQFQINYSTSMLIDSEIMELVKQPEKSPIKTTLTTQDNQSVSSIVHAIRLSNFTLLVFDNTPGGVSDEEMQAMHQRLAELEKLSATDMLTGAWNRLPLKRVAGVEIKRSLRYHHPISLVFFDIDYFKSINDTYGHKMGDEVLKELVSLVRKRIRESDAVYRWGGEEFVVLATSTDHPSAAILAESLRQLVEAHAFPGDIKLTISLGVAEFLPGDDLEMWLHRADKAAYAAKAKGRNQVVVDPFGGSDLWHKDKDFAPVKMVWHETFTCGNQTIDDQHRQLFEISNRLIQLALQEGNQDELLTQLNVVLDAIGEHFMDEEVILEQIKYLNLDVHKKMHQHLLGEAEKLRKEVVAGKRSVGHLLEYIAYDVVVRHILGADRDYFALIEEA